MAITLPPPSTQTASYSSSLVRRNLMESAVGKPQVPNWSTVQDTPLRTETTFNLTLKDLLLDDAAFRDLAGDVIALRQSEDGEEEGASAEAIGLALSLLPKAWGHLGDAWSNPFLGTDGYGGVRMTWNRGRREVRAVIPSDDTRPRYIYFEEENRYGTVPNFTDLTLASYLLQLHQDKAFAEEASA